MVADESATANRLPDQFALPAVWIDSAFVRLVSQCSVHLPWLEHLFICIIFQPFQEDVVQKIDIIHPTAYGGGGMNDAFSDK